MNTITIIAYMPDGETSRRGCVMEQWRADLMVAVFEEVEDAANFISGRLVQNERNRKSDDIGMYDVNVLINGKTTDASDWAQNNDNLVSEDYSPDLTEPEEGLLNLLKGRVAYQVREIADAEAARREQEKIAALAKAKLETAQAEARAKENRRRLFEDLKREFE